MPNVDALITRRRFVGQAVTASLSAILAACGHEPRGTTIPSTTPAPTRVNVIITPLSTITPVRSIAVGPVDLIGVITAGLTTPVSVTVDAQLNLFVIDNTPRVHKFAPNGQLIVAWGSRGTGDGELSLVDALVLGNNIATDTQGNLYIPDTGNARIQKFTGDGQWLWSGGVRGSAVGQFNYPHGVAVDQHSGWLYVADTNNHRVQVFDTASRSVTAVPTSPSDLPVAVAVDRQGNLLVVDVSAAQIQRFDPAGQRLTTWGSPGTGKGEFSRPLSCALDDHGNLYIADTGNHRIQQFDPTGKFLSQWGSQGTGDGQFQNPCGITIDTHGNIVVADTGNNRVVTFRLRASP